MLRNALRGLWPALRYLLTCKKPDVVVFLYPGHLDACVLGPIARLRRIPTVLDVFISLYDTVVSDRGLSSSRSPIAFATRARSTRWRVGACARVVVDTPEHARLLRAVHAPRPSPLRGAVGRRRGSAVRRRADDPGDDAPDPLVPHVHPAARFRDRRPRRRPARRRRPHVPPRRRRATTRGRGSARRASSGSPTSSSSRRSRSRSYPARSRARRSASACSARATKPRVSFPTRCSSARPPAGPSSPRRPPR